MSKIEKHPNENIGLKSLKDKVNEIIEVLNNLLEEEE